MYYYQIALRQVRDLFTWHAETLIPAGARVEVRFRGKMRFGIVVDVTSQPPDFKTAPVETVLTKNFLSIETIKLAQVLAQKHFTPLVKVLTLMVPEPFWQQNDPVKTRTLYALSPDFDAKALRHPTQKQFLTHLQTNTELWSDQVPHAFKNTFKTFLKHGWLVENRTELKLERSLSANPEIDCLDLTLTSAQQQVLDALENSPGGTLLWGVTGSGKTEIYKRWFKKILAADTTAQFLFLLPEIALTPQLIAQFQLAFGGRVAVWHSNLTPAEKVQAWARLQSGQAQVLVGTRSAALVPIPHLKAIVMDEEHEWTFKNEFAPRFWTHEIVELRAQKAAIPYLYGSATPKLRTYHQVKSGIIKCLELPERVQKTALPSIDLVDLAQEAKKGNFTPISEPLEQAITHTLAQGKQMVLFLNKRGFAGATLCRFCGHTFNCDHCDVTLKLHRQEHFERLVCHVCGSLKAMPKVCPSCEQTHFTLRGWGTQQLEALLREKWPQTPIFRADRDTISGRYDFEILMEKFKTSGPGILLGTQMIAKGLDFESVALVGIVLADVGLSLPDYSAEERVYQLLEQVSGRAGRRDTQGRIIVQTFQREAPLFQFLKQHDTKGFMAAKYAEHERLALPPFSHTLKVIVTDRSKATAFAECKSLHDRLRQTLAEQHLSDQINLSWAPAFFPRLHGKYWFYVFMTSQNQDALNRFSQQYSWPENIKLDLNPASLL